jgi:arylsulfatase A-like enzyme
MNRSSQISLLLLVAAGLFVAGYLANRRSVPKPKRSPPPPNIIVIMTDDQRFDALGVVQRAQGERARFPWLETPNLDRLASEGVRFRNAFVVSSLCSPSRATFLTGLYSHQNGVATNRAPFPDDVRTYAHVLTEAGYRSAYVGKWHMGLQGGPRQGFERSMSYRGHGRYRDCPFEIDGKVTQTQGWVDDVATDFALDFIREPHVRPFLLVLGFKSPHTPCEPPPRLAALYADVRPTEAPNTAVVPPYLLHPELPRTRTPGSPIGNSRAEFYKEYFRTVIGVDDNVGRILAALDEMGIARDTAVIFTSDNGCYLGEHTLGDKRSAYEESIRVPLLFRFPPLIPPGKTVDALALNIDLAPTLITLSGTVPLGLPGRSWLALLDGKGEWSEVTGPEAPWRTSFLYEYFRERDGGPPTILALRTETTKLVTYPGRPEWTEMFDLQRDPYEITNLATSPAHEATRRTLEEALDRAVIEVGYHVPDYADPTESPPPQQVLPSQRSTARLPAGTVLDLTLGQEDAPSSDLILHQVRSTTGPGTGTTAAAFTGKSWIEVPNTPERSCSLAPWTFEATVLPEGPSGVILARGGGSQGYALHLIDGRPAASVTIDEVTTTIVGPAPIIGQWTHLLARIDERGHLLLSVDGTVVGNRDVYGFIPWDPSEPMQIGTDLDSPVTHYEGPIPFVGRIATVRLERGDAPND